jgi:nitrate reductase delta subunit
MKLLRHQTHPLHDRLVWQCASLLLAYPDERHADRLRTVDQLLADQNGPAPVLLVRAATALRALDPMRAAADYVATFDMRPRATMYLTYWTAGDTRNRGSHMLAFAHAYREAGVEPPKDEAPDHLPVVLEFAATIDPAAGRRLLEEHRVAIEVLRQALSDSGSLYAEVVAAVARTLRAATDRDVRRARLLSRDGPATESVGLQPFTLTVPPRRSVGGE